MTDVPTQLGVIGSQQAREWFTPEFIERSTEREIQIQGLGIALAKWSTWDGLEILKVCYAALEDANFHSEAEKIQEMINNIESDNWEMGEEDDDDLDDKDNDLPF